MATITGLTAAEVEERKQAGQVNSKTERVTKSYPQIIIDNLCTGFNLLLLILGVALIVTNREPIVIGSFSILQGVAYALAVTGIILLNVIISTVQECKAKRRLDKIALLLTPKVTVLRDGVTSVISQEEIVKDDIIVLSAGDQALVDGELLQESYLEMDESLLTGESHTVRKKVGDTIYSGSYAVVGDGLYRVDAFAQDSFASKIVASAQKQVKKKTPLQMETTTIMVMLMALAILYSLVAAAVFLISGKGIGVVVETVAVILEIVPIALFLLIVISYMIAAIRMADSGVLLQDSSAVESISHVDTVCMDKTGTITTNKLRFHDAVYLDDSDVESAISAYIGSIGGKNRTIEALEGRYGPKQYEAVDEIRFSSERKYSAAKIVVDGKAHSYYMGALSSLGPHMGDTSRIEGIVSDYSSRGLRTVLFAESVSEHDMDPDADIPELKPLAVFAIEDEVRSDCRETIDVFLKNNMDLKVISGDDPATVNALFTIANIPGDRKIVSGDRLAELSSKRQDASDRVAAIKAGVPEGSSTPELDAVQAEFRQADKEYIDCILGTNIFGRMKPDQKEEVIDTLRANGRYVAMVGDGVNDVKSLKKANVGVALESGSGAARGVADMVLVKDNFSALPKALVEGKRTVSGMRNILKIYISRNLVLAILIAMTLIFLNRAPFNPMQNMFYSLFAVGISAFFMSFWAKPSDNSELVLPKVLRYALPTALTIAVFGLIIMAVFDYLMSEGILTFAGYDEYGIEQAASGLVILFLTFCGILQLLVVDPHFRIFSIDGEVHKDWKPLALMALLSVTSILVYNSGVFCTLMSIPAIPIWLQLSMIGLAFVWLLVQHVVLKWNKFTFMEDALESWYLRFLEKNRQKENEKFNKSQSSK